MGKGKLVTPTGRAPLVTVGLPVYNGARYLEEAVASILAQDFRDLELIISDNGSTDDTPTICRRARLEDSRVKYVREEVNRGAAWNFNRVLELARGRYFHWAAADDRFAPSYVGSCLDALLTDDTAVLAYTSALVVDGNGGWVRDWRPRAGYATQLGAAERFKDVLWNSGTCFEIFGLVRREQLEVTPGIEPFADSDRSLLTRLAMTGRFRHVDAQLYVNREHHHDSLHQYPRRRDRAQWFDPSIRASYPQWRLVRAFAASAWCSSAPRKERLAALVALGGWMYRRRRRNLVYEALTGLPRPIRTSIDQVRRMSTRQASIRR